MLQQLRLFLTAVQFFTRLPVPAWVGHTPQQLEQSARYLPLVGVLVGLIAAAVLWLTARVLPLSLAVGLSIAAGILVTGAFHEDGLSDFADGMGGGHTPEKILSIMKDSRIGAYGAIALLLTLLLKFQALLELCLAHPPVYVIAALVSAHSVSRMLATGVMLTQRYVRADDSARAKPAAGISPASFATALLTGLAPVALMLAVGMQLASVLIALGAALTVRLYLGWRMHKRLGGYTGDCLGAVQQLTEVMFYFGLLVMI